MKTKRRKKIARKAAMEVCWGISLAAHFGFNHKEMIEFIWDDFMKWADNTDFPGDKADK